jgi:hypothetical protein
MFLPTIEVNDFLGELNWFGRGMREGGMQLKGVETKNPRMSSLGKGREKIVVLMGVERREWYWRV